ncbi:hypothetical protein KP509_19G023100 [Ceratopteris richardii]|uniref:Uncharacterized protein n=1 Tax=Ceratopteris richardii TaxID=49495 RepID=A0A8T2SKI3_CERRI|nr:hypothetical protein KP509_19G023100 [Ceratopteris richardii]
MCCLDMRTQKTSSFSAVSVPSLPLLLLASILLMVPACSSRGGRFLSSDNALTSMEANLQVKHDPEYLRNPNTLPDSHDSISYGGHNDRILLNRLSSPSTLPTKGHPLVDLLSGLHTFPENSFNMLPAANPVPMSGPSTGHN